MLAFVLASNVLFTYSEHLLSQRKVQTAFFSDFVGSTGLRGSSKNLKKRAFYVPRVEVVSPPFSLTDI